MGLVSFYLDGGSASQYYWYLKPDNSYERYTGAL